jgi:hypothetical protein
MLLNGRKRALTILGFASAFLIQAIFISHLSVGGHTSSEGLLNYATYYLRLLSGVYTSTVESLE